MKQRIIIATLLLLAWAGTAFGQKNIGDKVKGQASYYHHKFQGKKTASGDIYDKDKYTAAHRTLPYGTMLKVTNKNNGRSVTVKVNDRGPFSKNRLIDLSFIAASDIDMIKSGVAAVEVEVISVPGQTPPPASEEAIAKDGPKEKNDPKGKDDPKEKDEPKGKNDEVAKDKGQKPPKDDDRVNREELAKKAAEKLGKVAETAEAVKEAVGSIKKDREEKKAKKADDGKWATGKSYSIWGTEQRPKGYGIQIGLFSSEEEAKKAGKEAIDLGMKPVFVQVGWENNERVYRVLYGEKGRSEEMRKSLDYVKSKGFNGFVRKHFN